MASAEDMSRELDLRPELLKHIVDVHCHPTDYPITREDTKKLHIRICTMASRQSDQKLVADFAREYPDKVIPAFGYHPWFSHLVTLKPIEKTNEAKEKHYHTLFFPSGKEPKPAHLDAFNAVLLNLPHPMSLEDLTNDVRTNVTAFLSLHEANPKRYPRPMVGEVGLDNSFRIPYKPHREPGTVPIEPNLPENTNWLSPLQVPMEHQIAVLEAQLDLAVELGVNVSLHSVNCPGPTRTLIDRMKAKRGQAWTGISIDFHSCGLSLDSWRDIERLHPNAYLSVSTGINLRKATFRDLIAGCAPNRLLIESDYHTLNECTALTLDILTVISEVKGWPIESEDWCDHDHDLAPETKAETRQHSVHQEDWGVIRRLEANWRAFSQGGQVPEKAPQRKKKKAGQ